MSSQIITQCTLFDYYPNEDIGDLVRLKNALQHLESDTLLDQMIQERGKGRNEYPIPTMFAIVVAQLVLQRISVAEMRRELSGNPTLRKLVRLNDLDRQYKGIPIVPTPDAFTSFYDNLIRHQRQLDDMFAVMRDKVFWTIPGYGVYGAGDGKFFDSYTPNMHHGPIADDRRADHDSTYSIKQYTYTGSDGKPHTKKETHYGFRKHTIVDALTELPLASILTPANEDERLHMANLIIGLPNEILERMKELSLDRGYDSTDLLKMIRSYDIIPVVDKRMMRKGAQLQRYKDTLFFYDDSGCVYYYDEEIEGDGINDDTGHPMQYARAKYVGYDKGRKCLRYSYGNKVQRFYIKDNERIFNEIARDSKKFKRQYNLRVDEHRKCAISLPF